MLAESVLQHWMLQGKPVFGRSDGAGLTFTLSAKGTAAWTLRYRQWGERRELTIGRYPDLGLDAARSLARSVRARIALGDDVAAEKRGKKRTMGAAVRLEQLRREVAEAEAEVWVHESAIKVARIRVIAARLALQQATERSEGHGQAD